MQPASHKPFTLSKDVTWLLIACQGANLLTLFQELTSWMLAVLALCLCWQILMVHYQKARPPRSVMVIFALSGCLVLIISGLELGLLSTMLHLLCFSYVLKALEIQGRGDFYLVVLLGFFLLVSALIFQQDLQFTLVILLFLLLNISVLLCYFSLRRPGVATLKSSGLLVLHSIPLSIVLFVIFPRLSPFWQVPMAKTSATGLSESVAPGDIASLALSDKLAFRANFDRVRPDYSQLYWRALVLENYDGRRWQMAPEYKSKLKQIFIDPLSGQFRSGERKLSYQVIAEASFKKWLFALDLATLPAVDKGGHQQIIQLPDYSLRSRKPLTKAISYRVDTYPDAPLDLQIPGHIIRRNLDYPAGSNPKLVQEVLALRKMHDDDLSLVQAVLAHFNQAPFRYTLQPPLLNENSLDQFYFDTRAGFCVHYASSFAFMMRVAGIPARLVTGYLGGEHNPQGEYYSIYQYDAHAWVEIWQPGKGWYRVDPTAAVNPERVENGLSALLLQEQSRLSGDFFSLQRLKQFAWLNELRLQLDAIDYQWTRLVLGYSAARQYRLLSSWFGRLVPWKVAAAITGTIMITLVVLWWLYRRNASQEVREPGLILYQQALMLLSEKGLDKPLPQTAKVFAGQLALQHPEIADIFNEISESFEKLTYQPLSAAEKTSKLGRMQELLEQFKRILKRLQQDKSA
ncbi:transglutaminase TgpA family protein [Thalassomonas haliotis]|uniref:DUF3488 domain-containing protein n=1 Tax=Thalassomonas haliotis TaxID=485448 RepID=A0ABY7VK38_9GAMM|nr:DUF3488 and DUF4129 domain-containing transglutaminase family protein [Thalassomonas haliotis]WDE14102.1 DUF3488 domain-containing protein [Thalassomonas haliotis]